MSLAWLPEAKEAAKEQGLWLVKLLLNGKHATKDGFRVSITGTTDVQGRDLLMAYVRHVVAGELSGQRPAMTGVRLRLRAALNKVTREGEVAVERELEHGLTLCGLRTMVDDLVQRVGGSDTAYLTAVELEPLERQLP